MGENIMRFSGKTVYITEASSAVGEALARRFASEGANLVLGDACPCLVKELEEKGAKVLNVQGAPIHYEQAEARLAEILKTFPRVDALIFNNNKAIKTSIENLERAVFDEQMNYNLKSAFVLTRTLGEHMGGYGNGKLVFVSSIHDDKPTGSTPFYSVAKGGITMLSKEAALFFGRKGLQSNVIELGALEGDDETFKSEFAGQYVYMEHRIPRGKAGKPEEVAGIAAFLASEDSNFVNGASIRADGGFMLHYRFR